MVRSTVAKYSKSRNNRAGACSEDAVFLTDLPKLAFKDASVSNYSLWNRCPFLFVIPTGANPDFLPRSARHDHVCGFH